MQITTYLNPEQALSFTTLLHCFAETVWTVGNPKGSKVITVCKTSHLKIKTVFQKESFCSPESDTMILREYRFCLLKASALIQTESEKK